MSLWFTDRCIWLTIGERLTSWSTRSILHVHLSLLLYLLLPKLLLLSSYQPRSFFHLELRRFLTEWLVGPFHWIQYSMDGTMVEEVRGVSR